MYTTQYAYVYYIYIYINIIHMKEMTSAATRAQREARSASDGATPITVRSVKVVCTNIYTHIHIDMYKHIYRYTYIYMYTCISIFM